MIFRKLYDLVLRWSAHRHAPYYLASLSFLEASVFPVPPDVMLAPMTLAKPRSAWRYALITTLSSTIGALLGYAIGMFFFTLIYPYLQYMGYVDAYHKAYLWFTLYGFWALFIAALTPIPFKLFTIAAGALHMMLLPFILACLLGRAARFYLVAGLVRLGGERMASLLRRYVDIIGWSVLAIIVLVYIYYRI